MIEIKDFTIYMDGGTIKITTDEGIFCFNDRLMSTTKGRLYYGYPMDDDSNLMENSEKLEYRIIKSLKSYKDEILSRQFPNPGTYQKAIDHLIKSKLYLFRDDIIEDILN